MIKLARAGVDIQLDTPTRWRDTGSKVSMSGTITPDATRTPVDMIAQRAQILGLQNNPDERVIRVVCDELPALDGFYEPTSADCDLSDNALGSAGLPWSAELNRIAGSAAPQFQSVITGALLSNSVAFFPGFEVSQWAVPAAAWEASAVAGGSWVDRPTRDGPLKLYYALGANQSFNGHWFVPPAAAYIGAARIEAMLGGGPLRLVMGREVENQPYGWRLSNGSVAITPSIVNPGRLEVSWWTGTTWTTPKVFDLTGNTTAGAITGFTGMTIQRNSPEMCVIRLTCSVALGMVWGRAHLDLQLRRGFRTVLGILESDQASDWQIQRSTAEASTAVTGGLVATLNDSEGNRFLLTSPSTLTGTAPDLTQGRIRQAATSTLFVFGVGMEIGGTASAIPDRWDYQRSAFFCAQDERQTVVGR